MTARSDIPYRKHLRLRGFDYRANCAYFVTICIRDRLNVFGLVKDDTVALSQRGLVARDCWLDIPNHHPHVELDALVIMPNHMHGILLFVGDAPSSTGSVRRSGFAIGPARGSLGAVVGSYKAAVSRTINKLRVGAGTDLWQPNYYEHVIRHDVARERIREYIETNPLRWEHDAENSTGDGTDVLDVFLRSLEDSPLGGERDAGVAPTGGYDA